MRRSTITLLLAVFLIAFFISFLLSLPEKVQAADSGGYCHLVTHTVRICEDIDGRPCVPGDLLCQCHDETTYECLSGYTSGQTKCACGGDPR